LREAESDCGVCLSRSGIPVHDDAASFLDEVECLDLGQYHLCLDRQFLSLEFLEVLHLWKVGPVYACYLASFAPPGHLLFQQPTQEGQVVLMTEEVCPAALAVAQGKDGHREGHLLVGYAQLDLAPVKLALLAWLIVLLDEYILRPVPLLGLALLDILAHA